MPTRKETPRAGWEERNAAAIEHIRHVWDVGVTVGVNPSGLLRTAVELADARTVVTNVAWAVFALEGARHLLKAVNDPDPDAVLYRLASRLVTFSEEMHMSAVTGGGL